MCALLTGIQPDICELVELVLGFSDPGPGCLWRLWGQITPNIAAD